MDSTQKLFEVLLSITK